MFFKMFYKNFFGDVFKADYQLDGFLEVPLTVEEPAIPVPKDITEKMDEILKSMSSGSRPMNEILVTEFMNLAAGFEEEFTKHIAGRFDPIDQEFAILDRKRHPS